MIEVYSYLTHEQARKSVIEGDAVFNSELESISDDLLVARGRFHGQAIKAVSLCGPTCAGKTTTAKKLTKILEGMGKRVHILSIDDFYYDREVLKKRSKGREIDFDSPETIDTKEFALTVREIFDDDETVVEVPTYDFKTGRRGEPRLIPVDDRDIFIIEGIQVFYPNVYSVINSYPTTSIYINTSRSIKSGSVIFPPAELRLLRRIVRDFYRREASPEFTFTLWRTVRDNEDKNIFPYCGKAKLNINSTVGYEIGMLKPYLDEILPMVPKTSDYYDTAQEILQKISSFSTIDKKYLAPDSLFHEFV